MDWRLVPWRFGQVFHAQLGEPVAGSAALLVKRDCHGVGARHLNIQILWRVDQYLGTQPVDGHPPVQDVTGTDRSPGKDYREPFYCLDCGNDLYCTRLNVPNGVHDRYSKQHWR